MPGEVEVVRRVRREVGAREARVLERVPRGQEEVEDLFGGFGGGMGWWGMGEGLVWLVTDAQTFFFLDEVGTYVRIHKQTDR